MYKASSGTLNLYTSHRDSQTFASRKADFRYVTGHSVLRDSQNFVTGKIYTLVSTAKHIQYKLYARTRAILLWAQPVPGLRPVLFFDDVTNKHFRFVTFPLPMRNYRNIFSNFNSAHH